MVDAPSKPLPPDEPDDAPSHTARSATLEELFVLEPGQRLVVIRYGNFYDVTANAYTGRIHTVGSEVTFLHRHGAYLWVENAYGERGALLGTNVSAGDPRTWLASHGSGIEGFLVDGMYDDTSGGSLDTLSLEDVPVLGAVVLEARCLRKLRITGGASGAPSTIEVTTDDGSMYRGRPTRAWLVTRSLRANLGKAVDLVLEARKKPETGA